jgi:hypothetical protein
MKLFKVNKYLVMAALLLITALLFVLGRHQEAHGMLTADAAVISLSDEEKSIVTEEKDQKVFLALKKWLRR